MGYLNAVGRSSASLIVLCLLASGARAQEATVQSNVPATTVDQTPRSATSYQDGESDDIVVTASKREQKLRDVPSAITVLTRENLETQGVRSIRDYATLTPGLGQRDQGRPGVGTIFIRGLSTGAGQQSATSVVYLDDVAFTSSSPLSGSAFVAPEPELADIDRIEVLKGPQGTLYGASSLGGVIRIVSRRPDSTAFSGSARVDGTVIDGGGTGYSARASLNVPLVTDRLAIRATGFFRQAPGYVDNVGTGSKNVNDSTSKGGRLALGWTPTDRLTINLVGQIENVDTDGIAFQANVLGTTRPVFGPRRYSQFFDARSLVRRRLGSATVEYETGAGNIIATGSYLYSRTRFETDATPTYGALLPAFGYPAGTATALYSDIKLKKQTAEVRFVSNRLGPVEFVVGGFQTHESTIAPTRVEARTVATNTILPGAPGSFIVADYDDKYDEVAGFGNLTVYLADRLDVTGGLRYAHNRERNALTFGGTLFGAPFLPPQNSVFEDDVLTYLATVRWRPTDTFSTFLRAASGYRPGSPQINPAPPPGAQTRIRPDTVWNYEAGFKGDFLDRTLSVEASAFHIDWKDVQLNAVVGGVVLLANAAKAEIDGFELQMVARPSRTFTAGLNLGYTNARITEISGPAATSVGARNGDRLPLTPEWTAAVTVDENLPLSDGIDGQLGATLRFQSRMANSYSSTTPDVNVRLPEITTLDLRTGVRYDRYQLQLRAENVFDRNGITNIVSSTAAAPSLATVIRPRSYTLSLGVNF